MTMNIEDELRAGMREQVAGVAVRTGLVAAAAQRHRRRTMVHRAMYATGVFGLAGALAAVVAVSGGDAPAVNAQQPAEPRLELVAAVTASQNISYRMKVTLGSREDPDGWGSAEGAYDPATRSGYLNSPQLDGPGVYYQRLVDGVLYLGSNGGPTWKQELGDRLEYGDALQGAASASADPEVLFETLRQAGLTVTETPAGYHFETSKPLDGTLFVTGTATLAGDISLDTAGRIAKVTANESMKGQFKPNVKGGVAIDSGNVVTVELSDYGTPVQVEKPTDVVVVK
ncbi:hypothetical protein DFJ67_5527 [Asanoa ferruginea]|uniref:Uncharacterized protein n=1 Tax=Asanoa ferruginea TaxID=53367 RepID=A0A3E0A043_9ACTN|nr:hypothetical protein [Asanoa ferruginea]REF99490.1 hypothetical protein DFJ67_5527 [Asanoa ferruginea]GIF49423.1 hypothetical protein Afe04nite_39620 [Asanoa ferruginea]